jgi:putative DNA primase/helicase
LTDDTASTSGGNLLLEAAHLAVRRGWHVLPLHRVGGTEKSCSCKNGLGCKNKGKHPLYDGWLESPMSGADVQDTWDVAQPPNLGVATGPASGFWVFDIDPDKGGTESAQRLFGEHGALPATRVVQTGSGGWHYYFAMPEGWSPRNKQGGWPEYPGLDVRGEGGLVVVEPSVTDKGSYRLAYDAPLAQAPAWLLSMVRPKEPVGPVVTAADLPKQADVEPAEWQRLQRYAQVIIDREVERLDKMRAAATADPSQYRGEPWDGTTFAVACTLLQMANSPWVALQPSEAYQLVFDHAPRDRDFTDEAVNAKWRSAVTKIGDKARPLPPKPGQKDVGTVYAGDPLTDPSAGTATPTATPVGSVAQMPTQPPSELASARPRMHSWDDLGLAERFIDAYGHMVRRVEQADSWAVFDGARWKLDDKRFVRFLAQSMIKNLPDTEGPLYEEDQREGFVKWAKQQRASARITACLTEAGAHPSLAAVIEDFDRDPLILNCLNGFVDLRTGQLHGHQAVVRGALDVDGQVCTDMLMQQAPVNYDPAAHAPRWQAFLDRVMPDPAMQQYLQMIVGYSITGLTTEQALFLHHGALGNNGKSVFLEVMSKILGDYGQVMPRSTLLVSMGTGEEHPTAIARQRGKRFMQASETARNRRLDEEMVKGLTGGEMQTARYMNKDFFDFKPTGKIHLVTNHLPRLTDAASIWRRMHLITWPVRIPDSEVDKHLAAKIIRDEAAGVLAWAVRGAIAWRQHGLHRPHASQLELASYREEQDEFGDFIRERLIVTDPDGGAKTSDGVLYDAYKSWCWTAGISKPMRKPDFVRTLKERNLPQYKDGEDRGFRGVTVKAAINDPLATR